MISSALILLVLWFSQTFLLDSIHENYTKLTIWNASETIADNIDNPALDSLLVSVANEHELSIYILRDDGTTKRYFKGSPRVKMEKSSSKLSDYWNLTEENNGFYYAEIENNEIFFDDSKVLSYDPSVFVGNVPPDISFDVVIFAREIHSESGRNYLLLLTSETSPTRSLNVITHIIFTCAIFFALLTSLIFSFLISRGLSKPVKKLSASAKKLAQGDYDVIFAAGGYDEISQLGEVLNGMAKKLRETERLREEFLANVSHDMRTPLTMISGYGEMMRDIPGENTPENIQIIIDESNRLAKLVSDVLDLSKMQSGTYETNPVKFCINDSIMDIIALFKKLSGEEGRIKYAATGKTFVNLDETLVFQAIYNLINNALKHSGKNATVTVSQIVIDGKVRISVMDNGCGIPEDMLEDIWKRYHKGPSFGGGTGLGLPIVSAAVKLCGGSYGAASKVGEGSDFWIELPVYKE